MKYLKVILALLFVAGALVLVFANRADWDRYALKQIIESVYGL